MTHDEAMSKGTTITATQGAAEIRRHSLLAEVRGARLFASADDGETWDRIPLLTRALMGWLGY